MTREIAFLFAFSLLPFPLTSARAAQPAPPPLTQPVNDFARVIDPDSAAELDRHIRALQKATGDVVVVATVPTFQPYASIEEYALKMFENHGRGIGARKDSGLLVVVAVEDRRVRIETGYDLEQFVTDGFAGQTIREAMAPAFKTGAYGRGLVAGVTRLINRVAEGRGVTLQSVPQEAPPPARPISFNPSHRAALINILIFLFIVFLITRRRRRRRRRWGTGPWSGWNSGVGPFGGSSGGFGGGFGGFGGGGGGGGGFGGFGGGRSGGGGASGGW